MNALPRVSALLCAVTLICGSALAQVNTSSLQKTLLDEMNESHAPGVAMVVVQDGKIVFAQSLGKVSAEQDVPVTSATLFRLGSTTKMITAVALLQLASDGKLDLDAPVTTYLPDLDDKFSRVTNAELLSHSAGLCEASPKIESKDDDALLREVKGWKGHERFYTEPGKMFSYAGPSYYLAGRELEQTTGKSYPDAMAALVFQPFRMNTSTLRPLEALTHQLAQGHTMKDGKAEVVRPMPDNVAMYPGGSIFASADDLASFMIALLDGGSASASVRRQFFQRRIELPSPEENRGKYFYGFGTVTYKIGDTEVYEHGGVRKGYGSFIRFIPARRTGIAIVANMNGVNLRRSVAEATSLFTGLKEDLSDPRHEEKPDLPEMQQVAGNYKHCDFTWNFAVKGNRLVRSFEGESVELKRIGTDYYVSEDGQEVLFVRDKSGAVAYVHHDLLTASRASDSSRPQR